MSQINIEIEELKNKTVYVPHSSDLVIKTAGFDNKKAKIIIGDQHYDYDKKKKSLDVRHKIIEKQNIKFIVSGKLESSIDFEVIKDFS